MEPCHRHFALSHYDRLANKAAAEVIKSYSSSFHAATCLYPTQIRQDIRNIYAVVRIADEIVDGTVDGQVTVLGRFVLRLPSVFFVAATFPQRSWMAKIDGNISGHGKSYAQPFHFPGRR